MSTQISEHLSEQTLEAYRERTLSQGQKAAVHDHVADCADCRLRFKQQLYRTDDEKAEAGRRLINILTSLREEKLHLASEQLAGAAEPSKPSILQRISAPVFGLPQYGYAVAIAAAVVVAMIVGAIMLQDRRSQDIADRSTPFPTPNTNALPQDNNSNTIQTQEIPPPATTVNANTNNAPQVASRQYPNTGNSSTAQPRRIDQMPSLNKQLNDAGSVIGLDNEGRVAGLESAPPSFQQAARQALDGKIDVPQEIVDLRSGESGATRSAKTPSADRKGIVLLAPVDKVIRTERPTFSWKPFSGSQYYLVTVVTDGYDSVERSGRLTQTQWTATKPLGDDAKYYRWQVEAYTDEGKEPVRSVSSWIKILDQAKAQELRAAETKYTNSHLLLGSLYAQAGLLDEAEREFQLLLKANPKSPVAQRLLKSVQEKKQIPTPK